MKVSASSLIALFCVSAPALAAQSGAVSAETVADGTKWAQVAEGNYLEGCGKVAVEETPRGDIQDFNIIVPGYDPIPLLKVEFMDNKEMRVTPDSIQYSNTTCEPQSGACSSNWLLAKKDDHNRLTYIEWHSVGSRTIHLICGKK